MRPVVGRIDWPNLRVAITGASSGIGAAAAELLAKRGAAVAIMARRKDRLDTVAAKCRAAGAKEVFVHVGDVGSLKDLRAFAAGAKKLLGPVDVVVANAGFGSFGNTLDLAPEGIEEIVRTNVLGAIWSVQVFGPQLVERRGHAIVVGSVVSKIAVPFGSVYGGTKWMLRGWTRGARPELEERGVALTLLNPGYVRTEFFEHRLMAEGAKSWNPGRGMSAEAVGKRVLRAIRRRPAEMGMTFIHHVGIPMYRLMPIQWPRIMAWYVRKRILKP